MRGEIDKDFYCLNDCYRNGDCVELNHFEPYCKLPCDFCRHKWPTPKQFRDEYGEEPKGRPVWFWDENRKDWGITMYEQLMDFKRNRSLKDGGMLHFFDPCYVACTPWGKPPSDCRPGV